MMKRRSLMGGVAALSVAAGALTEPARAQAKTSIKITRQPSIIYMPTFIMETQGLIEAHAAKLGAPGLKVEWATFNGGSAATRP